MTLTAAFLNLHSPLTPEVPLFLGSLPSFLTAPSLCPFLALFLLQIPYMLFLRLPSFLFSGLSSQSCPLQSPQLSLDYISSPDFSAELHGTARKGLTWNSA